MRQSSAAPPPLGPPRAEERSVGEQTRGTASFLRYKTKAGYVLTLGLSLAFSHARVRTLRLYQYALVSRLAHYRARARGLKVGFCVVGGGLSRLKQILSID